MRLPPASIGIMQGRLVPKVGDRVQSFPVDDWEREFPLAAEIGFDSIELTIEMASWDIHPLRTADGRKRLDRLASANGVALAGVCCDTVMERPLTDSDAEARGRAVAMTIELIDGAGAIGLPMIELPVMGAASLKEPAAQDRFATAMDTLLPRAETLGVDILVESDLPPADLAALMRRIGHPRLGINYDTGNSTWFGFDPDDELPQLMPYLRNVHIKDCTRADYSVPLGEGETDFVRIFRHLGDAGYDRGFVLQAARQADDVGAARAYFGFTRALVRCYAPEVA